MGKDKFIVPLKSYAPAVPPPKVRTLPSEAEQITALQVKLAHLETQLELAKDRIRRYREVVESEVKFWERGLRDGEWEGHEATRRRVSRLRGALEYCGLRGWGKEEEL